MENRTLEFKRIVTDSFLKTVSAFANFGTGEIKFGIDDDGSVRGIDRPERACLDIENKINDTVSPRPDFSVSVNGKSGVVTLTVSEGRYKPYLYRGKAYRRSGSSTVEVDAIELRRLILEGSGRYFESLPCERQDLAFGHLESILKDRIGISGLTQDMLRTFGFFDDDRRYTIAAALFADENPFAGIDIVRFGDSINEMLDRETVAHVSVLRQYDSAIDAFRRYYVAERIDGMTRRSVEKIPETAFREAVANAIVHRTWDIDAHIKIAMFADRIEITSPGGLPTGISEREYLNGNISSLRNPVVGNIFFRLRYIEMFGTGIKRIIESYRDRPIGPSFEVFDNSISIVLPSLDGTRAITGDGSALLAAFRDGVLMSGRELAEIMGWSRDKTIRELNRLKDEGRVIVSGIGRSTRYAKR